ncbi:NADH ubiquinone oxidoreductase 20 kDa subunit [Pyrolobus fumarii 1A]|uniref:NADH ubiquinone oxidoreductase 20 kDa subunit n=1 Tax=Pyrolobus fumarii (strain DSM 11204 / 1A) TaxID=694429 RepID=G0EDP1_PYRF1|nr:NADH ubiquinone oxidoreductase 20 kDa subunit [Pyrolobus fumarii 1A]
MAKALLRCRRCLELFEIVYWPMLVEETRLPTGVDVVLVTGFAGSIEDVERLRKIMHGVKLLVSVGCCALNGGVFAVRGLRVVPPAVLQPKGTPLVRVPGCPPQLEMLETILSRVAVQLGRDVETEGGMSSRR